MDAKGIIVSFIGLIGGIVAIGGLWGAMEGYVELAKGKQLKNDMMVDKGRDGMIYGLAIAGGVGTFTTAIIAAVNALNF